jgi:hypothetical protein
VSPASIRLSRRDADAIARFGSAHHMAMRGEHARAFDALRSALAPKPKSSRKKRTEKRRRTKAEETRAIYEEVAKRAGNCCEACGIPFCSADPAELDHQLGRKVRQSVENCWLIHRSEHRARPLNTPSAQHWWEVIEAHAAQHGHSETRRAAEALANKHATKAELGAAR